MKSDDQKQPAKHTAGHKQHDGYQSQDEAADAGIHQPERSRQRLEEKAGEVEEEGNQGAVCSGKMARRLIWAAR